MLRATSALEPAGHVVPDVDDGVDAGGALP
jgi:hypothetical protein